MSPIKIILPFFFAVLLIFSVQTGYEIGSTVDNRTELNSSLSEIESNYTETQEQNLTVSFSELEKGPNVLRQFERLYYNSVIKPIYWGARGALDMSYVTIKTVARATYSGQ